MKRFCILLVLGLAACTHKAPKSDKPELSPNGCTMEEDARSKLEQTAFIPMHSVVSKGTCISEISATWTQCEEYDCQGKLKRKWSCPQIRQKAGGAFRPLVGVLKGLKPEPGHRYLIDAELRTSEYLEQRADICARPPEEYNVRKVFCEEKQ